MDAAASPVPTPDDAGLAAFFAKAEAREPLLGAAVGFVPSASRVVFRAWCGLLAELRECAFELSDPRITVVKAGWWAEELDGVARGAARHPLTRVLLAHGGPWQGAGDALLAVAGDADPAADLDGAIAALHPLADALVGIERHLFGAAGPASDASRHAPAAADADAQRRALAIHWLRIRLERGQDAPDRARVPLGLFARHGLRREQLATAAADPLRRDWATRLHAALPMPAEAPSSAGPWPYPRLLALAADRSALDALAAGRTPHRGKGAGFLDVGRAWRLARNAALPVRATGRAYT